MDLPDELLDKTFSFLSLPERHENCRCVNRSWQQIAEASILHWFQQGAQVELWLQNEERDWTGRVYEGASAVGVLAWTTSECVLQFPVQHSITLCVQTGDIFSSSLPGLHPEPDSDDDSDARVIHNLETDDASESSDTSVVRDRETFDGSWCFYKETEWFDHETWVDEPDLYLEVCKSRQTLDIRQGALDFVPGQGEEDKCCLIVRQMTFAENTFVDACLSKVPYNLQPYILRLVLGSWEKMNLYQHYRDTVQTLLAPYSSHHLTTAAAFHKHTVTTDQHVELTRLQYVVSQVAECKFASHTQLDRFYAVCKHALFTNQNDLGPDWTSWEIQKIREGCKDETRQRRKRNR